MKSPGLINATVTLSLSVVLLLGCIIVASAHGARGRRLLGEDGRTWRNYTAAVNYTLMGERNESKGDSKVTVILCYAASCEDGKCYCCNTRQPEPCFHTRNECWQNCQICSPKCPLPSASSVARARRSPSQSIGYNIANSV
ncbi:hypothetical protein EJB05_39873 [Eragrostis curvula]|uniref:Embryo surrounding factor 1 brassicaceae domain-containing protein n=1 Tax=Eragrostis curvula TaxID=38414 RepID=A0A5J9TYB3_9POAL|nr:hypothetical protein EJB05_39873 [Eragrostis curvula]